MRRRAPATVTSVEREIIDLRYGDRPSLLGSWRCGELLIDCGPSSCLQRLLDGLGSRRPRALLLTHIHLDHAGAAGALVEHWPDLQVYVHPRGAAHLIDPSRLLASARRVFGTELDSLLGAPVPVPAGNVHELADGEQVGGLRCLWTPGHASHHVVFFDESERTAFSGDLAGVCLAAGVVVPPTPPPDIDLDSWQRSLTLLEAWQPARLALAHYGTVDRPREHIAQLRVALERHASWARAGEEAFERELHTYLCARMQPQAVADHEFIAMAAQSAAGLRRWLAQAPSAPLAQR
jgi:glyoxylase-like metal-dependent hydrolase (beta-lactamase superfamily II)